MALSAKLHSALQYLLSEKRHHHLGRHTNHQDIWIQVRALQQLLCIRPPSPRLPPQIDSNIDALLQYQQSHILLTPSQTIPAIVSLPNTRTSLHLWKGDITTLTDITAFVNAANSELLGYFQPSHRCIDNVVHSAAGPRLREVCHTIMQKTGPSRISGEPEGNTWGLLGCDGNVAAVGGWEEGGCFLLYFNGIFAFPPRVAVEIAVDTVTKCCQDHPETSVTNVIFDVFAEDNWELYERNLKELATLYPPLSKPLALTLQKCHAEQPSIRKALQWLQEADTLIISAGVGLSAATGLDYTSRAVFTKYFPAFVPLGLHRLYDVFGFDGWMSSWQKWGYYFNHLAMTRPWPKPPLYDTLKQLTHRFESRYFIRTSNADGFFVENGFDESRISTPQGQYRYLQCLAKCCRDAVFLSESFLTAALPCIDPETQCLIDVSKVPVCKYCGGELTLCVRGEDYFNPVRFREQEKKYQAFLGGTTRSYNTVILETVAGMNTPVELRWHNEGVVRESEGNVRLVRAGIGAAECVPLEMAERNEAIGIEGELGSVIDALLAGSVDVKCHK